MISIDGSSLDQRENNGDLKKEIKMIKCLSCQFTDYLPFITPSGLSIGIILKMKLSLNKSASASELNKNCKTPKKRLLMYISNYDYI